MNVVSKPRKFIAETPAMHGRLRSIVQTLLSRRVCTSDTLARKLGVDRRTIQRDIKSLREDFGYHIVYRPTEGTFVLVTIPDSKKPASVHVAVCLALYVAADLMNRVGDPFHREQLERLCAVLRANVQDTVFVDEQHRHYPLTFALSQTAELSTSHAEQIFSAITKRESLLIEYRSVRGPEHKWRMVDPYHVYCRFGTWYLIAHCHTRRSVRLFRADRIKRLKPGNRTFAAPNFNVTNFLGNSINAFHSTDPVKIVLRVRGLSIRWFSERTFHPSQKITLHKNKTATITLNIGHTPDLETWLLGWGPELEIVRPLPLREAVKKLIDEMKKRYSG